MYLNFLTILVCFLDSDGSYELYGQQHVEEPFPRRMVRSYLDEK